MRVRPPAVAGAFYDGEVGPLERDVRSHLSPAGPPEPVFGAIVPHAGFIYSGPVAGAVYARIAVPPTAVILCPNHTGRGAPASVDVEGLKHQNEELKKQVEKLKKQLKDQQSASNATTL